MDRITENALNIIKKKIKSSGAYASFVVQLTGDKDFVEVFNFNGDINYDVLNEAIANIDNLKDICLNTNKEKEFHDMVVKALKEVDKDAISIVVDTYFIEILYGNPDRLEMNDYTFNDKMFYILQGIFGLDTLTLSIENKKALFDRYQLVFESNDINEINNFINIIEDIYKSNDSNIFKSKKDVLNPYILSGLGIQLNEISNNPKGNFSGYNNLQEILSSYMEYDKKM